MLFLLYEPQLNKKNKGVDFIAQLVPWQWTSDKFFAFPKPLKWVKVFSSSTDILF